MYFDDASSGGKLVLSRGSLNKLLIFDKFFVRHLSKCYFLCHIPHEHCMSNIHTIFCA